MTDAQQEEPLAGSFGTPSREDWLKLVDKALKGGDFEKRLVSRTADGLRIDPLYTRANELSGSASELPGAAPFTRGTDASPRGLGWDIRQLHIETDARAANTAILEDLEGGVTSIALQFAAPGQLGLAPTADALGAALANIDLTICPIALQAGGASCTAADALQSVWQQNKIGDDKKLGAFHLDPLGTLAGIGSLTGSVSSTIGEAISVLKSTRNAPGVTALIADGRPYHAAGASEAEELAAMLSTLVAYLRASEDAGIAPEDALPQIAVGVVADTDQFLTIAKFKAARRLVWRVADAAGAGDAAQRVQLTATSAWRSLAKRDPWVNLLRGTMSCAAAVFGGANSITVLPFTLPLGRADSFTRRVARNTQIVLQEESNLGCVVDPAGGSWYVDNLTNDLAQAAWTLFQKIEGQQSGSDQGMAGALQSGFIQDLIAATADKRANEIATGKKALTGTSTFPRLGDDGVTVEAYGVEPEARPSGSTGAQARPLNFVRVAEPFERLRDAADAHEAKSGKPPQVFLASLGAIVEHTGRTTWMKNFLAAGGIEALVSNGYADAGTAAEAFKASGAKVACICSSDGLYGEHGAATAKALKSAGASHIYLAGKPGDLESSLKSAGLSDFLYLGRDAIATLGGLHDVLGVNKTGG